MQKMIKALAVVAMALAAGAAQAQSPATTTFQVSAEVLKACEVSASNLVFGDYSPLSAVALDRSTDILVTCTTGTTYNVGVGDTPTARTMTRAGGGTLSFGMYSTIGRTDSGFSAAGTTAGTHIVYGRVPAGQFVTPGTYTATVNVSVTY